MKQYFILKNTNNGLKIDVKYEKKNYLFVPDATEEAVDLFQSLVMYNSQQRLSAQESLKHIYFSQPPLPAQLDYMPKPKEKRSASSSGSIPHDVDVSFNEMFADLFELASK